MYSLLLMSAMTSAPETTEFHGFFRDLFNSRGGCSGSCSGSRAASQAPSGCCGGTRRAAPNSCCGSGASQSRAPSSCCGSGYYASCQGSSYAPSYVVMTQPMDYYPQYMSGCTGSMPMGFSDPPLTAPLPGSPPPGGFAPPQPATPPAVINENAGLRRASYASAAPERATVIVRVPADATLSAEGRRLNLTGDRREFVTPPLPPGDYRYGFRCDYERNGESISRAKSVIVRAGETFVVDFSEADSRQGAPAVPVPAPAIAPTPAPAPARTTGANPFLTGAPKPLPVPIDTAPPAPTPPAPTGFGAALASSTGAASSKARMLITLPAGAVLFIDGRNLDRPERTRQLETPPIAAGQSLSYVVRVERQGANGPESQQERVTVRGGEALPLDFTKWPGR